MSTITKYFNEEILNNVLANNSRKVVLMIEPTKIKKGWVTLKIGLADEKDFVLIFDTVTMCKNSTVRFENNPKLSFDLKDWIHFG